MKAASAPFSTVPSPVTMDLQRIANWARAVSNSLALRKSSPGGNSRYSSTPMEISSSCPLLEAKKGANHVNQHTL
jgi:hypothetical protein